MTTLGLDTLLFKGPGNQEVVTEVNFVEFPPSLICFACSQTDHRVASLLTFFLQREECLRGITLRFSEKKKRKEI